MTQDQTAPSVPGAGLGRDADQRRDEDAGPASQPDVSSEDAASAGNAQVDDAAVANTTPADNCSAEVASADAGSTSAAAGSADATAGDAVAAETIAADATVDGAPTPADQLAPLPADQLPPAPADQLPPTPSDQLPSTRADQPPPACADQPSPPAEQSTQTPAEPDEDSLRLAEALVFASAGPVSARALSQLLPETEDADAVIAALRARYAGRGVELVETAGGVQFRTAPELAPRLRKVIEVPRKLPRVAMETLAIIAYHQPCTRPEIEEIRGTSLSQQTLDALLEANLVAPKGRREVPGRPTLWGTTPQFLAQFGLRDIRDLPQRADLLLEPPQPSGVSNAPPLTPELSGSVSDDKARPPVEGSNPQEEAESLSGQASETATPTVDPDPIADPDQAADPDPITDPEIGRAHV